MRRMANTTARFSASVTCHRTLFGVVFEQARARTSLETLSEEKQATLSASRFPVTALTGRFFAVGGHSTTTIPSRYEIKGVRSLSITCPTGDAAVADLDSGRTACVAEAMWKKAAIFAPFPGRGAISITLQPETGQQLSTGVHFLRALTAALKFSIYETRSHEEMTEGLLTMAASLQRRSFVYTTGSHARTLRAPKGEGKTTMLRAFAAVCGSAFPSVIPVYISYLSVEKTEELRTKSVQEIVERCLCERDVLTLDELSLAKDRAVAIQDALQRSGKQLFLLVDEVDELYRIDKNLKLFQAQLANSSMLQLSDFGTQTSGNIAVVICGSTVSLSRLVSCNVSEALLREFPNLHGAPHLNGTKYLAWRVHSAPGVDLGVAMAVLASKRDIHGDIALARVAAFWGGSNARVLDNVVGSELSAKAGLEAIPFRKDEAQKRMSSITGKFANALLQRMWKDNRALLSTMWDEKAATFNVERIKTVDWEVKFKPLTAAVTDRLWQSVAVPSDGVVFEAINELQDLSYISLGLDRRVYPAALSHLFLHRISDGIVELLLKNWEASVSVSLPGLAVTVAKRGR